MKQLPLLVGLQQRHDSTINFFAQEKSKIVAESLAILEYMEKRAYMCCVIEVDQFLLSNTEKITEVFKITRNCKCIDIQRYWNFEKTASYLACTNCGIRYSKEEPVNEQEQNQEVSIITARTAESSLDRAPEPTAVIA